MQQCIICPYAETIAVIYPTSDSLTIEEVAKQTVPVGVPYRIIDTSELPADPQYRDAWAADFSEPDGYGEWNPEPALPIAE
jgi:hypothetical protein